YVHGAARGGDVARAVGAADDTELLHRVRIGKRPSGHLVGIDIVGAIQRKVHAAAAHAVDGGRNLTRIDETVLQDRAARIGDRYILHRVGNARREEDEVSGIASVE